MFIRFREMTAERYGEGKRECAGKCRDRPRYHARWVAGFIVKGRTFLQGCPMKPLCPLVHKRHRLEVSIVETYREGGRVRQRHVASLGSVYDDSFAARENFWLECEARLARLSNRVGPNLDRLRQAIAARIPPLTDADREAMDSAAWDRLEGMWDEHAKDKAYRSSRVIEDAKQEARRLRREATEAEVTTLQVKSLRGNWEAYSGLNGLLGVTLAAEAFGKTVDHDDRVARQKDKISAVAKKKGSP
jgi:hypothetical protein